MQKMPRWARELAAVVALVSRAAGVLVLIFPRLGFLFVVYFLAFALVLLGVERLGMSITGHGFTYERR